MGHPVTPNTEPGAGTQYHAFATPPDDTSRPSSMTINSRRWKVGHDYLDTELRDLVTLVEIVGKSTWADTRDPSEAPPRLIFESDRVRGQITVDPHDPSGELEERFLERYRPTPEVGELEPYW